MAEQVKERDYFEILDELFFGKDAALEKYAKVRFTQYEMNLWRCKGLPLWEVFPKAKRYFGERFLKKGVRIDKASPADLNEAFTRLDYAVGKKNEDGDFSGCHGRCLRLINELNDVLVRDGIMPIKRPEKFLDYLTFDYTVRLDCDGNPIMEKPYSVEIRDFHDSNHRKVFREYIKLLKGLNRKMSMQNIYSEISSIYQISIPAKK